MLNATRRKTVPFVERSGLFLRSFDGAPIRDDVNEVTLSVKKDAHILRTLRTQFSYDSVLPTCRK